MLERLLSAVSTILLVLNESSDEVEGLHIGGHIVYGGNENSIKLWTRNLKGQYCFGYLCVNVRIKLKYILKYIG